MFAEPPGFDRNELIQTLAADWGLSVTSLRYEPVGFGTHHYVVRDDGGATWFVNVDEIVAKAWLGADPEATFDGLDRALRTALALRMVALEFVHAPVERSDGGVVARLPSGYAVSVFAYVDGSSNEHGVYASVDERRRVLEALGRIHAATHRVPAGLPRRDTLVVPLRERLFEALDDLGSAWTGGPFGEPARMILVEGATAVRQMFDRYDALVPKIRSGSENWVVTHGEPHGSNVMRTDGGGLLLIDWDTTAVGPRERDLWMIEPKDDQDWAAYASTSGVSELDPAAIELYRLWWDLSEITGYTDTFRSTHADDANTRVAWLNFQSYVPSTQTRSGR